MQSSLYKLTMLAAAAVLVVSCGGGGSDDSGSGGGSGGGDDNQDAKPFETEHKINPIEFGDSKLCATTTIAELKKSTAADFIDFDAKLDSAALHQYFSQQVPSIGNAEIRQIYQDVKDGGSSAASDNWLQQLGEVRYIYLIAPAKKDSADRLLHPIVAWEAQPRATPYDFDYDIKLTLTEKQSRYGIITGNRGVGLMFPIKSARPLLNDQDIGVRTSGKSTDPQLIIDPLDPTSNNHTGRRGPGLLAMVYAKDKELRRRLPNTYCFHRAAQILDSEFLGDNTRIDDRPYYSQHTPELGLSCLYLKEDGRWITFWIKGNNNDSPYAVDLNRIEQAQKAAAADTSLPQFNWLLVGKTRQQIATQIDTDYKTLSEDAIYEKYIRGSVPKGINHKAILTPYENYNDYFDAGISQNFYAKLQYITADPAKTECN